MTKKIFGAIIAISLLFFTSSVFATSNDIGSAMSTATNTVRNAVGGAENVVENAAGAIGTGVKDLGNTFTDGAARVTNNNSGRTTNTTTGYTATRTATRAATNNDRILGMSANVWTWFVLAIAAIAIVGLVWYYAMQHTNEYDENNR